MKSGTEITRTLSVTEAEPLTAKEIRTFLIGQGENAWDENFQILIHIVHDLSSHNELKNKLPAEYLEALKQVKSKHPFSEEQKKSLAVTLSIVACDAYDHFEELINGINFSDAGNLEFESFLEAVETGWKLIQLANFFINNENKPDFISENWLIKSLLPKLQLMLNIGRNFLINEAQNKKIIRLSLILLAVAYDFIDEKTLLIDALNELIMRYRFLWKKNQEFVYLQKGLSCIEFGLQQNRNQNKNISGQLFIDFYTNCADMYFELWDYERIVNFLEKAAFCYESATIEKQKLNMLLTAEDHTVHMIISTNITLGEHKTQSGDKRKAHFLKAKKYAELGNDPRKLADVYLAMGDFYEKNYFVKEGRQYVSIYDKHYEKDEAVNRFYRLAYNQVINHFESKDLPSSKPSDDADNDTLRRYVIRANNNVLEKSRRNKCSQYSYWSNSSSESKDEGISAKRKFDEISSEGETTENNQETSSFTHSN